MKIYVPIIYILMTGKTARCYQQAFNYIKWEVPGFEPYSGRLDFELAFFRTARQTFPKMELIGCLFHFKKACREKMEKLGIDQLEIEIAMKWGVFDLLTIFPTDELTERGIPFVREKIMNLIYDFYVEKDEIMTSEDNWDAFWECFT